MCINVLTECRHGEDAVSHAADSGWGGEDQTAAVIWDWSCKAGIWYEGWCSVTSFYIRAMVQAYVTVDFVVVVAGGAKVWNGETEKRAGGEDGWSDKNQGKPAEQREGDLSKQEGFLYFITSAFRLLRHTSVFVCQVSEQANSSMTALQAEKERLMRSVSEKEAELSSLRQAAQVQQSSLQQEREKNTRELGELQGKLKDKVSSDQAQLYQ